MIVRTSVGRAFVPKPLRLLLVRLLPGDDRAEVVHEGLGVGRALDASQQFAPGVEHEVERNGAAPVPSANISKKSSFFIRIEFSGDGCKNRTGRLKNGF